MAPVLVRIAAFLFAIAPALGFVNPGIGVRATVTRPAQVMMAGPGVKEKFDWVPILPISESPAPGTAKSVFVLDLDLCVAADENGLLYVLGNKCPPANQPLSFSTVANNIIKDPVLGTKIDIETGDVVQWCPSIVGKLLSPILGPKPDNAGVPTFKVRSKNGKLEAFVQVNAKAAFESSYWKGILDAQGKADGGYF